MNIAVCDDEIIFVQQVVELIKKQPGYDAFVGIDTFLTGAELLHAITIGKKYDLIFLDIMLTGIDGISIVEKLKEYDCIFVLISSNHSYVSKAFLLDVSQYLFKPIKEIEFTETYRHCMELYRRKQQVLTVKIDGIEHGLALKKILYFESKKRKVIAVDRSGQEYEFYEKLDKLEDLFNSLKLDNMLRVHQSYIVNLDYCIGFREFTIYLQGDKTVKRFTPISTRKEKEVRRKINLYLAMNA